jgi:hypothetical protein
MLDHIAQLLLGLLTALGALVLSALSWLEAVLGQAMTQAHIPQGVQEVAAIALAVLFLIAAVQMLGGFIRVVVVVVLLAIVVHAVSHPGKLRNEGSVQGVGAAK